MRAVTGATDDRGRRRPMRITGSLAACVALAFLAAACSVDRQTGSRTAEGAAVGAAGGAVIGLLSGNFLATALTGAAAGAAGGFVFDQIQK